MKQLERCKLCGGPITIQLLDKGWWIGCKACARSGMQFVVRASREMATKDFVKMNT